MTSKPPQCVRIEAEILAAGIGEAEPVAAARAEEHVARCAPCREEYRQYRAIDAAVSRSRAAEPDPDEERVRSELTTRLADLRRHLMTYRIFPSPLGNLLIARSELGVTLIEYLGQASTLAASRLGRREGIEAVENGEEIEALYRDVLDYLAGRRTRLDWPLDLTLARGEFDRRVLAATAGIPYGAVTSYAGIAREIGTPRAVRAVAQALRWNPIPIVIPCHRVIGTSGALTGYAGNRLGLKERLLTVEGVPTDHARTARIARRAMYHYDANPDRQYCLPTCGNIVRRPLGQVQLFSRRELAEAQGLAPCTDCRPDLHPLVAA